MSEIMSKSKPTVFYIASTHWDREWYQTFQAFRYQLVELMDELFDTMQRDERYRCFQTDGQSILLEDYLEIRPEKEEQARAFCEGGRLRLGPWYSMPDEFLVAPESLIRNLEFGLRVAREYGNVSKAGFVCDMFGHISQLPQIFQGFGINNAYVFRGTNEDTHGGSFLWRGPDGSELIGARFGPRDGYFDYGAWVRKAFKLTEPFVAVDEAKAILEYAELQGRRAGTDLMLIFDGGDHMPIEPHAPELLEAMRKIKPEYEYVHTGLDEYAAALTERRDQIKRVWEGEMREPGRLHSDGAWLIPGVTSSRIYLKQDNRRREAELFYWLEPFSHLANKLIGREYPHGYLRHSWRWLLKNHAHDSICGCSPDQIHKDMEFRFDQCRLINKKVLDNTLKAVAQRVDLPDLKDEEFALLVFNPTQADIDGPVDVELWFDSKTDKLFTEFFHYEAKVGFRVYDAADNEIPYDYTGYAPLRRRFYRLHAKIPQGEECLVVDATMPLKIPAGGYTTIICKPAKEVTRHPLRPIGVGDRRLENEHLRVDVQDNGSLKLFDKRTSQTYDRLLVFEERADIGDGWFHGVAVNDQIFSSTASHADVCFVENGTFKATLRITNRLQVPERFEFERGMRRSDARRELVIESYVTLRQGADHLEIRTAIENNVRDHRVRVLFESNAQTDTFVADSAFDVLERPIALPEDNHTYRELVIETTAQANWTAVHDQQRGLAVVAPELPETGVRDVPERTLALTLIRGFRRTIFTDGEEGGQCLGRHEFTYRLVPLNGAPARAQMAELAQLTIAGVKTAQLLPRDQLEQSQRTLPRARGQYDFGQHRLVMTSFRQHPEKGYLELRVFNPEAETVTDSITLNPPIRAARYTDFEGNELGQADVDGQGRVTLKVPPKKIVTLALEQQA